MDLFQPKKNSKKFPTRKKGFKSKPQVNMTEGELFNDSFMSILFIQTINFVYHDPRMVV